MSDFVIDNDRGIGYFKSLWDDFKTPNLVTYDNQIWGNMSKFFSNTDDDIKRVESNNQKLKDILGIEYLLSMTTPLENTFIDINKSVLKSLFFEKDNKHFPIHCNAIIVTEKLDLNIGVVVAPRDCAVVVLKSKKTAVSIVMHLGFPQVVQGLYKQVMLYFSSLLGREDLSDYRVYIYPYITPKNYKIRDEKVELLDKGLTNCLDVDNGFDFVKVFSDHIKSYRIEDIVKSGIDTYDAAKNGNMYSYTLEKELRNDNHEVKPSAVNVIVKI
jgi:hypothetical protein